MVATSQGAKATGLQRQVRHGSRFQGPRTQGERQENVQTVPRVRGERPARPEARRPVGPRDAAAGTDLEGSDRF